MHERLLHTVGDGSERPGGHPFRSCVPFCGPQFKGASPDLGHVVLASEVALTESRSRLTKPEKVACMSGLPDRAPARRCR